MKKLLHILVALIVMSVTVEHMQAQNLVPNPSFEDSVSCPTASGDITKATNWTSLCGSPDYFNTCNQFDWGVPNNVFGYQLPASGNAYTGFATYSNSAPNSREYPSCNLATALNIGTKYYVSFKVALALNSISQVNTASDKIGAMFTTNPYICNTLITNNPPVFTDSVVVDSLNWTRITGSFIADSNYIHLVIGNFFDDANTDTIIFINDFTYNAYYYLDDVCVSTDSSFCANYIYTGIEDNPIKNNVSIYPNPANNYFNVNNQDSQNPFNIRLYNTLGQELLVLNNITEDQIQIDISDYKSGLLFIKVESKNKSFTYKLLKQ